MKQQTLLRNQNGFTLVEIIAVLIILGILSSVAVPRYINLGDSAKQRSIDTAISELNSRENLVWANQKISTSGYDDDQKVLDAMDYNLGSHYRWSVPPTKLGGTIEFNGLSVAINRNPSTANRSAFWSQ